MPVSTRGKDRMFEGLLRGPLFVGLYRADETDEETDPGYERQPVQFDDPTGVGPRTVANRVAVRFGAYMYDAKGPVRGYLVMDADGGVLLSEAFERPREPMAKESCFFEAGDLVLVLP